MEKNIKETLQPEPQKNVEVRERTVYEKQALEVYYLTILQYAIFTANHQLIRKVKEFYEMHGFDFNRKFLLAEQQLIKIKNPENTLKPLINSLDILIKSFQSPN
jgi:hypothetical protein